MADRGDFDGAKAMLRELEKALEEQSVSYQARHEITVGLMETVRSSIRTIANRSEYSSGGRAMMSEAFDKKIQEIKLAEAGQSPESSDEPEAGE